jgi:predicted lipoprotein with Yx(FWY)xxD motif
MSSMKPRAGRHGLTGVTAMATVLALAVAGCGGDDNSNKSSGGGGGGYGGGSKPAASSGAATVGARSTGLGQILVGPKGRTLYLFEKDKGPKSTCSGACANVWPPFTTSGKPKAGAGVTASMIGTTKRSDGKTEVTYNGHPLYYYAADTKPGDTKGQELDQFGAEWYAVSPKGEKAEKKSEGGSGGGSKPSSSGGY